MQDQACKGLVCANNMHVQVQESDMHRVATATGAQTQTTVNNLNPQVLGTVEAFEEKQVKHSATMLVQAMHSYAGVAGTLQVSTCGRLYKIYLSFAPCAATQEGNVGAVLCPLACVVPIKIQL